MMFSDAVNRTCLRPFVAHFFDEPHFAAGFELAEIRAHHCARRF